MTDQTEPTIYCNRCGRATATAPISVDDELVQEYVRSMLAQKPFSRVVSMLGGALKLTFETASGNGIRTAANYAVPGADQRTADTLLLLTLVSIEKQNPETGELITVYKTTQEEREQGIKTFDDFFTALGNRVTSIELQLLRRASLGFNLLCNTITEHCIDSNFYEGVGLR